MEYETMSPPQAQERESTNGSANLTPKQYFLLNLSKILVEMAGTAALSIFYFLMAGNFAGQFFGYWVISLFAVNITGAHFNPAVTVAEMFRKNSNFGKRRLKGFIYLLGQFAGAILGAFAMFFLSIGSESINIKPTQEAKGVFQAIISETFGTFIFVLFFMISTDKKTQYSEDKVMNCFIIASSYITAQMIAGGGLVTQNNPLFNPFIAFSFAFFEMKLQHAQYYICPFIGSALAVLFYEFIFVKTQLFLQEDDVHENQEVHENYYNNDRFDEDQVHDKNQTGFTKHDKQGQQNAVHQHSYDQESYE